MLKDKQLSIIDRWAAEGVLDADSTVRALMDVINEEGQASAAEVLRTWGQAIHLNAFKEGFERGFKEQGEPNSSARQAMVEMRQGFKTADNGGLPKVSFRDS